MYQGEKVTAVIVAAGVGMRMGIPGKNKVYLDLVGIPVLTRTITAFEKNSFIDEIIVAVRPEEQAYCLQEIIRKNGFRKVGELVPGGAKRQDTVAAALDAVSVETTILLVHDGARPLIDQETIHKAIEAAAKYGAAAVGVPVKDTIKVVQDGFTKETPDRKDLWAIQTPQGFRVELLKNAVAVAQKDGFYGTDEAVLLEKIGKKVFIVEGKYDNIKVTTVIDIAIAEAIIRREESIKRGEPV